MCMLEDEVRKYYVWDQVRSMVYPVLISGRTSETLAPSIVRQEYLDMVVIYIIRDINSNGRAENIRFTTQMLEYFDIDLEDLAEAAYFNLIEDGYKFMNIEECLMNIRTGNDSNDETNEEGLLVGQLYVLTNRSRFLGASGLLYHEMIRNVLGKMPCYILPSSIHETLFLPVYDGVDAESLSAMVREINCTNVDPSEQLSDHIYYYDGESDRLQICA